jgi:FixJ family two-component response regulator
LRSIKPNPQATVFIVDDDALFSRGSCEILRHAGFRCEVFSSAREFLAAINPDVPGCLLLDIRMPEMSGPELQSILHERGFTLPIIFLSGNVNVRTAVDVLQRGAIDMIEKTRPPDVLIRAVQNAIERDASERAKLRELYELRRRMRELTPREHEVADLLALGNSNRQIAIVLGLSERTIEIHRGRIMAKMQCDSIVNFGIIWLKVSSNEKPAGPRHAAGL